MKIKNYNKYIPGLIPVCEKCKRFASTVEAPHTRKLIKIGNPKENIMLHTLISFCKCCWNKTYDGWKRFTSDYPLSVLS